MPPYIYEDEIRALREYNEAAVRVAEALSEMRKAHDKLLSESLLAVRKMREFQDIYQSRNGH